MVPHIRVEEEICKIVAAGECGDDDSSPPRLAVTAVPDEKKGERLIVLHEPMESTPEAIREGLSAAGLPNLFVPSSDAFIEVESIPMLGTGKLDLKAVRELAIERTATTV